ANVRALDAIPYRTPGTGPAAQPLDAPGHELQFACDLRLVVDHGVNVERCDVAALYVFGVVLGMVPPDTATDVIVPRHALPEIEQHRARRVGGADTLVVLRDLLRQNRRAVAFALAERLRVVRLIAVHPSHDDRMVLVLQPAAVLRADHGHAGPLQIRELIGRR